jgi:hypothetical protein
VLHGIPDVDKAHLLHTHLCLIPACVSCVPPAHARLPRDLLALDHHRRVSLEPLLFTGHPINPNHNSATPPHHGPRHLMFCHDISLGAPTRCYVLPIGVRYSCAQAVVFPIGISTAQWWDWGCWGTHIQSGVGPPEENGRWWRQDAARRRGHAPLCQVVN